METRDRAVTLSEREVSMVEPAREGSAMRSVPRPP
jgi:hypothetical protein